MALVYPGAPCPICGAPIGESDIAAGEITPLRAYSCEAYNPLYRYSDTVMHKSGFEASPLRDALAALSRGEYAADREISFLGQVTERRAGIFSAEFADRDAFDRTVVLSFRSTLSREETDRLVAARVRVAPLARIRAVIDGAPGIDLGPRPLSFAPDRSEYALDRAGPYWADIRADRAFFVAIPTDVPLTEPHLRAIWRERACPAGAP